MLSIKIIGINSAAIGVANVIAAPIGHPTSIMSKLSPSDVTSASAALPSDDVKRPITRFTPTNPTPTVTPALKDFASPCPRINPKIVRMIGSIVEGPSPRIKSTKL